MPFGQHFCYIFKGKEGDANFAKVAKQRAKQLRLEKVHAARPSRGAPRRGGYHPYAGGSRYGAGLYAPSSASVSTAPTPLVQPSRPPFDKSNFPCNYCKELGHFVKECPKLANKK